VAIIVIHLLGLAPAGYLTAPDNGPEGLLRFGACQCDGCRGMPLNPLNLPVGRNLRGGKRSRLRFRKGCLVQHTYPFSLNRPRPVGSLQLCSLLVLVFALSLVVWEPVAPWLVGVHLQALVGKPPPSLVPIPGKVVQLRPSTGQPGHHLPLILFSSGAASFLGRWYTWVLIPSWHALPVSSGLPTFHRHRRPSSTVQPDVTVAGRKLGWK
jgi:hypothetical protein